MRLDLSDGVLPSHDGYGRFEEKPGVMHWSDQKEDRLRTAGEQTTLF